MRYNPLKQLRSTDLIMKTETKMVIQAGLQKIMQKIRSHRRTTLLMNLLSGISLSMILVSCTPPSRPYVPRLPQTQTDAVEHSAINEQYAETEAKTDTAEPLPPSESVPTMDPEIITRPANYRPYRGNLTDLRAYGKKLYRDQRLSTNGQSCNSCHQNFSNFTLEFTRSYPHRVAKAVLLTGKERIQLDEMIQLCILSSMEAQPLIWNSRTLAALVAYTEKVQQDFRTALTEATCPDDIPCDPGSVQKAVPAFNEASEY